MGAIVSLNYSQFIGTEQISLGVDCDLPRYSLCDAEMRETIAKRSELETRLELPGTAMPVFILGILPRSGTHFLANLLCLHPDCTKSAIPEDSLLGQSRFLNHYVSALQRQWLEQTEAVDQQLDDLLWESLGEGLLRFLEKTRAQVVEKNLVRRGKSAETQTKSKRIITKTPMVEGLENFFRLFPRAHLLILVRDGRAVVESNALSFEKDRERITRTWAKYARKIVDFDRDSGRVARSYLIVRYEDLVTETEREMRRVLSFLELDERYFDFEAALEVPVVGSSTFKRGDGPVHWLPVRKTPEFNPLARADHWDRAAHERFNWLAGRQLTAFGYEPKLYPGGSVRWATWNRVKDLKWSATMSGRKLQRLGTSVARRMRTVLTKQSK